MFLTEPKPEQHLLFALIQLSDSNPAFDTLWKQVTVNWIVPYKSISRYIALAT